jgi:hypothetical protein
MMCDVPSTAVFFVENILNAVQINIIVIVIIIIPRILFLYIYAIWIV